jgi:hypothetical protein
MPGSAFTHATGSDKTLYLTEIFVAGGDHERKNDAVVLPRR